MALAAGRKVDLISASSLLVRSTLGEVAKCRSQIQNHPEGKADGGFLKLKISILAAKQNVLL